MYFATWCGECKHLEFNEEKWYLYIVVGGIEDDAFKTLLGDKVSHIMKTTSSFN